MIAPHSAASPLRPPAQAALRCQTIRHVSISPASGKAPRCLRVDCRAPALLLVERGEVTRMIIRTSMRSRACASLSRAVDASAHPRASHLCTAACALPPVAHRHAAHSTGQVAASAPALEELREPRRLQSVVSSWLESVHQEVARKKRVGGKGADDSDDDDDDDVVTSYCGRAGCRAYPHEHLGWGDIPK